MATPPNRQTGLVRICHVGGADHLTWVNVGAGVQVVSSGATTRHKINHVCQLSRVGYLTTSKGPAMSARTTPPPRPRSRLARSLYPLIMLLAVVKSSCGADTLKADTASSGK
jgi:hypothetical protein